MINSAQVAVWGTLTLDCVGVYVTPQLVQNKDKRKGVLRLATWNIGSWNSEQMKMPEYVGMVNLLDNDHEKDRPTDGSKTGSRYLQKFRTTGNRIQILVSIERKKKKKKDFGYYNFLYRL